MSQSKYQVNIDVANQTKKELAEILPSDDRVINKLGAFASLFDAKFREYQHPVLVLKTEEPGTKQFLAFKNNRIESVCRDMVHHLINDCIMMGAKPLAVQDAILCGEIEKEVITRIVSAVSEACKENACVLTGGETSEQPGVLSPGMYLLTSSIVGVVEKEKIIDGSKIRKDHTVIGIESSGLHTNGYTLVRKLLSENTALESMLVDGRTFMDAVLESHRCYYQPLKDLFSSDVIKGLAHITGGGIKENLNRILPNGLDAVIDLNSYQILEVFKIIKNVGEISDDEMLRIFNISIRFSFFT